MSLRPAHALREQAPPYAGARWLDGPEDERKLIGLLEACYGSTYSHKHLYNVGSFQALWREGRLASLGSFDDEALLGHTGLWFKDPEGDFAESGLSLMDPRARLDPQRVHELQAWPWLRARLSEWVGALHQNTTTLHAGAQLYALRHIGAQMSGLVPAYAEGESLLGLAPPGATMHALTMTTPLRPIKARQVCVPSARLGGAWLAALAGSWGLEAEVVEPAADALAWTQELERAPGLGLVRRRAQVERRWAGEPLEATDARVDLLHLPAQREEVAGLSAALWGAGYVPVGLRLGFVRPHELVWWRGRPSAEIAAQMVLAHPAWEAQVEAWTKLAALQR